jgi:hypothetical protein
VLWAVEPLDREGVVVYESKSESTATAIAVELSKAPSCHRIVFESGRMAPILFHGLSQLSLPVVCVESRQAYQALKSLATHKTDRNDARGLAHLARAGFFKPTSPRPKLGTTAPRPFSTRARPISISARCGRPRPEPLRFSVTLGQLVSTYAPTTLVHLTPDAK